MTMPSDKTKILVCQLDEKAEIVTSAKATNTHNLLSCLSAATTTVYGLIILCFATRSIHAGFGIIELCRCLKSNLHCEYFLNPRPKS